MRIENIYELFSLNGRDFVFAAYRNLLGREPDEHGLAYYLGRLSMGYDRESVIIQLAKSSECRSHDKINGLEKFIKQEQRAKYWLWRLLYRSNRLEKLSQSIAKSLDCIDLSISSLSIEMKMQAPQNLKQHLGFFDKVEAPNPPFFGEIKHNPLVSLIAVNYNGAKDLPDFLKSVSEQSYTNFELIVIDNNSSDNSENIVNEFKNMFETIKFIQSGGNIGFAAGNNYALAHCNGELICLINIDTIVNKEWLKELVDAMSGDGNCAAVASKTLFYERFQDIEFSCTAEFDLQIETLIESLDYKKYFVRHGIIENGKIKSREDKIIISLPIQDRPINICCFQSLDQENNLYYKIGRNKNNFIKLDKKTINTSINYSKIDVVNSSYIINNAGSFNKDGMPADRGFGEYDEGQYDSKCYVDFFCGVSVLLRRSAIVDRKIFVSEFFAYYEDSELSRWLIKNGYKILYAPRSVLRHKHSATSSEGSALWNLLVNRSRSIYTYNGNNIELHLKNNHLEEYFKSDITVDLYRELKYFSSALRDRLEKDNEIVEKLKPIAIYNSYWNTKGGGESHALSFARILQEYDTVYLVSESDFNLKELAEYYNMDLSGLRKIVEPNITEKFTEKFFIFINACYRSNLKSNAMNSYYIVSFPHKDVDRSILRSYHFLCNSEYTKKWVKKYWADDLKEDIVYPLGMIDYKNINVDDIKKEKIILSVGRFFVGEHSKNQHIIAQAFRQMVDLNPSLKEWKLVLIGGLNLQCEKDMNYYEKIDKALNGLNYDLIINADRATLNEFYKRAYIYLHASGFGNDPELDPNKFEHFGIAPVEAMVYGCYPIVYSVGGPSDLTSSLDIGDHFSTFDELLQILNNNIQKFDQGLKIDVARKTIDFLNKNAHTHTIEKIMNLNSDYKRNRFDHSTDSAKKII